METTPLLSAAMRMNDDRFYMGMDKHMLLSTPESGLSTVEAARRLKQFGPNELEDLERSTWRQILMHFTGPMPLLLWLAMVLELFTLDYPDFAVLLFLQLLNGCVGWLEQVKTTNSLMALRATLKPEAQVIRDGVHQTINAALLVPGDRLSLSVGCAVPADCDLCEDSPIQVDQSALTGESFPVTLGAGDNVKMGSLVVHGEVEAIVSATGPQTFLGMNPPTSIWHEKNQLDQRFTAITMTLLVIAVIFVSLSVGSLLYNGDRVVNAIGFGVVLFVAAVPMTLRSVCTSILAAGSRQLAMEKVVVTQLQSIETMSRLNVICCDKTGTLTRNKMELQDDLPIFSQHVNREDILVMAALAAKWREPPKDAIDTLVLNAIDLRPLDQYTLVAHTPFDPTTKRTESTIRSKQGKVFKVTKGAPHMVLALAHNFEDIQDVVETRVLDLARRGVRCLAVARTEDYGWVFMGLLTFTDPPRHDTKRSIELLQQNGVALKMLTGDQAAVAIETAHLLQVGTTILGSDQALTAAMAENADGFANVFPSHKTHIVELLQKDKQTVCGVTGADVQDAQVLRTALLGIAVDGASDAAKAAADVVMMKPGLAVILHGIMLSRHICQRIRHYVTYRIACGMHILLFFFIAIFVIRPNEGYYPHIRTKSNYSDTLVVPETIPSWFHLPVIAIVLLLLLNDGTIASTMAQDRVGVTKTPQGWNGTRLFIISGTLSIVSAVGSIILLCWSLNSWQSDNIFVMFGLGKLHYRQVLMVLYLKLALTDCFLVFSARTDSFFFLQLPSKLLFTAALFASVAATTLSLFWPFDDMQAIDLSHAVFVWVYSFLWLVVQDCVKILVLILYDLTTTNPKPARMEWQRQNRMQLGALRVHATATPLSASGSSSFSSFMLRDSYVAGRVVRGSQSNTMNLDQAMERLARLETEIKAVRQVIQAASASAN